MSYAARRNKQDVTVKVLLCDPVCMLTCVPTLLYSFIYKRATLRDAINNPLLAARWFVARDRIVAETFCRCASLLSVL